jgi:hypothetical protein
MAAAHGPQQVHMARKFSQIPAPLESLARDCACAATAGSQLQGDYAAGACGEGAAVSQLLATSPTVEGIQHMVNRFWCSDEYRVDPQTLAISHPRNQIGSRGDFIIRKSKGRYRFERVTP